jgi:hypothetical protein
LALSGLGLKVPPSLSSQGSAPGWYISPFQGYFFAYPPKFYIDSLKLYLLPLAKARIPPLSLEESFCTTAPFRVSEMMHRRQFIFAPKGKIMLKIFHISENMLYF